MRLNNVELRVVVKDKAITEYVHNGQTFIEGREGSNFEIVVTNHNAFRVEAVVAVDGLSILDGKEAGPQSDGYLLNPRETIAIPGWKLNESQVAAFQFSGKGGSYSALTTGSPRNTGVIGLLVYREKYVPRHNYAIPNTYAANPIWGGTTTGMGLSRGIAGGSSGTFSASQLNDLVGGVNLNNLGNGDLSYGIVSNCMATGMAADSISQISASCSPLRTHSVNGPQGQKGPEGPRGDRGARGPSVSVQETDHSYQAASVQNLGTGFGAAQAYATQTVDFSRGDMLAMLVLYYDNARGLKARGIVLTRSRKDAVMASPNAFPGLSGCVPPAGWQG